MGTDLKDNFDCLSHELIIAKFNAYGFSLAALMLPELPVKKTTKN